MPLVRDFLPVEKNCEFIQIKLVYYRPQTPKILYESHKGYAQRASTFTKFAVLGVQHPDRLINQGEIRSGIVYLIHVIDECRLFFNFMLPSEKIEKRRIGFDSKFSNCTSLLYYFNICP